MGRPYSDDLRERVLRAVIKGGLSRHQAAAQFGVGISTAINWVQRFHETGSVKPDQIGGYRPKKITGPHREWLIQRCRKDFTVRGLVAELAERGSVWPLCAVPASVSFRPSLSRMTSRRGGSSTFFQTGHRGPASFTRFFRHGAACYRRCKRFWISMRHERG